MSRGIDASVDLTRFASSLAANYNFAVRYYNIINHSKNLTLAEANILNAAGLRIAVVWENGHPTRASYFSFEQGVHDGTSAYHYASVQIQQPADTPIYFAVDYDASPEDTAGVITEYFNGIQQAFNTISRNSPVYVPGVYGSGLVCSTILNAGLAAFAWLAQSTGWRGSKTFQNYNIKQGKEITECVELGGVDADTDESPNDNEGSFVLGQQVVQLRLYLSKTKRAGLLDQGIWNSPANLNYSGSRGMRFSIKNEKDKPLILTIRSNQDGDRRLTILPKKTVTAKFAASAKDLLDWKFKISANRKAYSVSWKLYSAKYPPGTNLPPK
jgi:hypothetical protein